MLASGSRVRDNATVSTRTIVLPVAGPARTTLTLGAPDIDSSVTPSPSGRWHVRGDFNIRDRDGTVIHNESVDFILTEDQIALGMPASLQVYIPESEAQALAVLLGRVPGTWELVICCQCKNAAGGSLITVETGPVISTYEHRPVHQKIPVGCKDCPDNSNS